MGRVKKRNCAHTKCLGTTPGQGLDSSVSPHVSGLPTLTLHFLAPHKWAMDKPDGLVASGQLQNSPSFCPFCSLPGGKPVIFLITVFFDSPRKAAFMLYEGRKFSPQGPLCLPCGLVERPPQASHPVGMPVGITADLFRKGVSTSSLKA